MRESNYLTIVIPSYNRPDKLLATLKQLVPQLVPGVSVAVLDNCSPTPYELYCTEAAPEMAAAISNGMLRFIRHRYNVGMSANFMKGFEICDSEWMWLIADDDAVLGNAISLITNEINALKGKEQVAFIKFSSPSCKNMVGGGYVRTLDQLINILAVAVVHFDSYIFITNGLYRIAKFKEQVQVGYATTNTYVPHLMMLLDYLNNHQCEDAIFMSDKQVASYMRPEKGYSYGIVAGLGVGAFKNFSYDLTPSQYRRLEAVFAAHDDFKVGIDLFYFCHNRSNMFVARRLVDNYYQQIKGARSFAHCMAFRVFCLLFYTPRLFEMLIGILPTVRPETGRHILEMREKYRK
jgi:glycosyltransferase involved in cell wall biosynthesis